MKLCFVGGGNMAGAMISGLLRTPTVPGTDGRALARGVMMPHIHVIDPDPAQHQRLNDLARERGLSDQLVCHLQANATALTAEAVVLAVKPQAMRQVCAGLAPFLNNSLVVSVAAGIRSGDLARWLKGSARIVRCMPNTPALIGLGVTGAYAGMEVSPEDRALVKHLLESTGALIWLDQEEKLDVVTALSGSGPAYVFYFMEAMISKGQEMGLTLQQAHELTLRTFEGASALATRSQESPEVLRHRVTSKGGTTFAALEVMRQHDIGDRIGQALEAANKRATEMGVEFGKDT